jgi:hypothetical protein
MRFGYLLHETFRAYSYFEEHRSRGCPNMLALKAAPGQTLLGMMLTCRQIKYLYWGIMHN